MLAHAMWQCAPFEILRSWQRHAQWLLRTNFQYALFGEENDTGRSRNDIKGPIKHGRLVCCRGVFEDFQRQFVIGNHVHSTGNGKTNAKAETFHLMRQTEEKKGCVTTTHASNGGEGSTGCHWQVFSFVMVASDDDDLALTVTAATTDATTNDTLLLRYRRQRHDDDG